MRRIAQKRIRKNLASAVAVAGILSLGTAPAWAQQSKQGKPTQSKQSSQSQPRQQSNKIAENLIPASTLQDQEVVDAKNREIGTITNLFVDPQSGRIQRADIEFSTSLFGPDHK